jgi:hypothetical protein
MFSHFIAGHIERAQDCPLIGASTSIVALAVSNLTRMSPADTSEPSVTFHSRTTASSPAFPVVGTRTSVAMLLHSVSEGSAEMRVGRQYLNP